MEGGAHQMSCQSLPCQGCGSTYGWLVAGSSACPPEAERGLQAPSSGSTKKQPQTHPQPAEGPWLPTSILSPSIMGQSVGAKERFLVGNLF